MSLPVSSIEIAEGDNYHKNNEQKPGKTGYGPFFLAGATDFW